MRTDVVTPEVQIQRKCNYQIAPLPLDRWSPRSITGEPLTDEEFLPLFEAARWTPSSFDFARPQGRSAHGAKACRGNSAWG